MKAHLIALFCLLVVAFAAQEKILGLRNGRNHPQEWRLGDAADPTHPLTYILALKQQNLDVLEEKFWSVADPMSPEYRNFMTIDQIGAIVNPPKGHKQIVLDWLTSNGATDVKDFGDALEVKSSVQVAEKLFNTQFAEFKHSKTSKVLVRQVGLFSVPANVADYVDMVSGLTEFPVPKLAIKRSGNRRINSPQALVTIAPQSVGVLYNVPSSASVTGNSSGSVIEFEDQYFSPKDLDTFAKQFAVTIPPITPEHIIGKNDPNNPQIEAALDIEWVLGVGLNAEGWFWIESDTTWLYGFGVHMFGATMAPLVNSISYGWNEEDQCENGIGGAECKQLGVDTKGYVARVNTQFQKIGLRGISLISASGDSGANGRTDPYCTENHLNPPYPAASPYITSVGGTQIDSASGVSNLPNPPPGCTGRSCASGGNEEAVSFAQAHYASGGGFSFVASAPAYQTDAVAAYLASGVQLPPSSYYNAAGRGFPDVAGLGSEVLIVDDGRIEPVGGTSCSSPIFAGIMSLINDHVNSGTGKPLGFLNPLLYTMAAQCTDCFQDITKGDNICTEAGCAASCKGFQCAKGWDPVTGLGTPNYGNMLTYITKLLKMDK